jgi:site-specific DNA recombinase
MLVTILGSLAQEESRNISENVRWGIARKFEEGKVWVNYKFFLGYTKNEDGELAIVPEEAEVVRLIFRLYLEGLGAYKIKRYLEEKGMPTVKGCKNWSESTILRILGNEKYMGDALLQKTYTADYLTKTRRKNDGAVRQYYIRGSHEGIIPKELFYRVQEERMRRAKRAKPAPAGKAKAQAGAGTSKYILGRLLVCGKCGRRYRRVTWSRDGEKRIVWRCGSRVKDGTRYCKDSATLDEKELQRAVMRAISRIARESPELQDTLRQNIAAVLGSHADRPAEGGTALDSRISALEEQIQALLRSGRDIYSMEFRTEYQALVGQVKALKEEKARQPGTQGDYGLPEGIMERLRTAGTDMEFDQVLVGQVVEQVKVINRSRIEIYFKSGWVERETLAADDRGTEGWRCT